MTITSFISSTLLIGVLESAPLMLAAVGFTIIFRLNNFMNIAYAENATMGAYLAVTFNALLGMNFYFSIIPAVIASGALSTLTYLLVFRPAKQRGMGSTEMIILSVGLSFFIRYGISLIWGSDLYNFNLGVTTYIPLFDTGITLTQIICLVLALLVSFGLYLFIYKTNYGETMRALSTNEELAKISGINPIKVSVLVWFLAGVAGGLAGIFTGVFTWVNSGLGWHMALTIILVASLGRVGDVRGALIAGAGVGVITTFVSLISEPAYGTVVLLMTFILILKLRKVRGAK